MSHFSSDLATRFREKPSRRNSPHTFPRNLISLLPYNTCWNSRCGLIKFFEEHPQVGTKTRKTYGKRFVVPIGWFQQESLVQPAARLGWQRQTRVEIPVLIDDWLLFIFYFFTGVYGASCPSAKLCANLRWRTPARAMKLWNSCPAMVRPGPARPGPARSALGILKDSFPTFWVLPFVTKLRRATVKQI